MQIRVARDALGGKGKQGRCTEAAMAADEGELMAIKMGRKKRKE